MFHQFCDKFLPIYLDVWPGYSLAIWSAPVQYEASGGMPAKAETSWEALRITVRNNRDVPMIVLKKGTY